MIHADSTQGSTGQPDNGVEVKRFEFDVAERHGGKRLDAYLAGRFSEYSCTFIKALIQEGAVTVNGGPVKPSHSPSVGDRIVALVPMQRREQIQRKLARRQHV